MLTLLAKLRLPQNGEGPRAPRDHRLQEMGDKHLDRMYAESDRYRHIYVTLISDVYTHVYLFINGNKHKQSLNINKI